MADEKTGQTLRDAENRDRVPDIVIITGMSGSGRTQALHCFEDMGYFCIDNLPPRLVPQLADLVGINSGVGRHLAVTCDLRSQGLFDELTDTIRQLGEHELSCKLLFLDASDEVLMRRYNENRRRHPLAVLRTSALRTRLNTAFSELTEQQLLDVNVFSFGFKHGMPSEADLMIDVRFLPNPFYDPEMRHLTGNDEKVARYVMDNKITRDFMDAWLRLLDVAMPGYVAEGKARLSIAVGCTGGQHRSVAIANATAAHLKAQGYRVNLFHCDLPEAPTAPDQGAPTGEGQ